MPIPHAICIQKTLLLFVQHSKNTDKITIHKITSDNFFENNNKTYNFIYIDGCHEKEFIKRDMENSFNILEKGGIMWMDDYRVGNGIISKKKNGLLSRKI